MVVIHQWVPVAAPGTAQAAQEQRFLPNTGCYFGRCMTRESGRLCGKLFLACSATLKRTETSGVKPCSCSLNWARPRSRHSIREMLTAQTLNNQPTSLQYLWHIPSPLIASSLHPFTVKQVFIFKLKLNAIRKYYLCYILRRNYRNILTLLLFIRKYK